MEIDSIQSIQSLLSPGRILLSVILLVLAWVAIKVLAWVIQVLSVRFQKYRLQITRLFPIVRVLIWVVALYIVIVVVFRPDANVVLALSASVGIAVGLASQDILRNFFSGMLILFDQPFRVGDMVQVGGHYGAIHSIGMRSIQIHTFDDSIVTIPNSVVMSEPVINANSGALEEMVVVEFQLPSWVEVGEAKGIGWEAAVSSPYAYLKKPAIVTVRDHHDREFLTIYQVKAYVLDVKYERIFAIDVLQRIKREISRRGLLPPPWEIANQKAFS